MKSLALLAILVLHATGLWSRLPDQTRHDLVNTGANTAAVAAPATATSPAPGRIGAIPIRAGTGPLLLDAAGAIAFDTSTNTVLYSKNPTAQRPIASVTKLVTSLVILSRHSPAESVTIPRLPAYGPEDERIGLVPGETYRLSSLIEATLVQSANDAADSLARWDAGTQVKFAAQMNAKMGEWGITGTRFSGPSGLQDADNYASAEALGKIAKLALANPLIRQTVGHTEATITSGAGRIINLETTNKLLASGQYYGIKTGYTLAAGECFVGLTRINGHEVITVVLGSSDRFGATTTLTNWIGHTWQWL
ncbi:MAG: serine-type D-Ala-D-Ala carboxypeptidase D-alanyl-D-alanine carboxypeptidase [Patescibacteria group bacterium]|jgi:D-alanyl-D-alanine carboxypeptidase (penicillin-binding protein 5/6)|nr:serine-type D-Ala-D-Ala carboxypeptidase D-alanyl-D-alanine carboxypeptidase [Patescibacteria group bacterium]